MAQDTGRTLTRRERLRAETLREILTTSRTMLIAQGWDGLSLRAIARTMGMSAPALYRYYPSREDLVVALVTALKHDLVDTIEAAKATEPADDPAQRLLAASRAFRTWAVRHPAEFTLTFASQAIGLGGPAAGPDPAGSPDGRLGGAFGELIAQLYAARTFPIPADDAIDPALRTQLADWAAKSFPKPPPLGLAQVFLSCWMRLYGAVSLEAFGLLSFALTDAAPMFEAELRSLAANLGIADRYRPPS
jgi:AcrR family transcriptional regulator